MPPPAEAYTTHPAVCFAYTRHPTVRDLLASHSPPTSLAPESSSPAHTLTSCPPAGHRRAEHHSSFKTCWLGAIRTPRHSAPCNTMRTTPSGNGAPDAVGRRMRRDLGRPKKARRRPEALESSRPHWTPRPPCSPCTRPCGEHGAHADFGHAGCSKSLPPAYRPAALRADIAKFRKTNMRDTQAHLLRTRCPTTPRRQ